MAGAWSAMDPLAALSSGDSSSEEDEGEQEELGRVEGDGATSSAANAATEGSKESTTGRSGSNDAKEKVRKGAPAEAKKLGLDYEALSRHGYTGGPSIMHVPAPTAEAGEQDWSWSSGKRKGGDAGAEEESISERERTREVTTDAAEVAAMKAVSAFNFAKKQKRDAIAEQKAMSFSQKEKRKREMGQASRGKNYVEEEKRLLRDQGVYSGFDT